jgi:hypothetical protein
VSLTCAAARSGPARSGGGSAGSRADRSTGGPPASLYNGELASRTRQYSLLTCPPTDTFWTAGRWSLTRCCSSSGNIYQRLKRTPTKYARQRHGSGPASGHPHLGLKEVPGIA